MAKGLSQKPQSIHEPPAGAQNPGRNFRRIVRDRTFSIFEKMNASEFNTELGKLVNRAMKEGIAAGKMDPLQLVGSLDFQSGEIMRHFQDAARAAQQPLLHLPRRPGA